MERSTDEFKPEAIRAEVEAGNFQTFIKLQPAQKILVISGHSNETDSHLDWKKLAISQQVALLNLLIDLSFERLYLRNCTGLSFFHLFDILNSSPQLKSLELSDHFLIDEDWIYEIFHLIPELEILILKNLPLLERITSHKLMNLEYLVVSDNPHLRKITLNAPRLKFLEVQNNPKLNWIKTNSDLLKKANLQNNKSLVRKGLTSILASLNGLRGLEFLSLEGSDVIDSNVLQSYPILLTHEFGSDSYTELIILITIYLGEGWQTAPLSAKEKIILGIDFKDWFYRYDTVQTFGVGFNKLNSREQILILILLQKRMFDGYAEVSFVATKYLLEIYKTVRVTKWLEFIKKNASYRSREIRDLITQNLLEYCQKMTPNQRTEVLPELFTLLKAKNSQNICLVIQILGKFYSLASNDERYQILDTLQNLIVMEIQAGNSSMIPCAAIEALAECFNVEPVMERQDHILTLLIWWVDNQHIPICCAAIQALGHCFKTTSRKPGIFTLIIKGVEDESYLEVCSSALEALGVCYPTASKPQQTQIVELCLDLITNKLNNIFQLQIEPSPEQSTPEFRFKLDAYASAIQVLGKCYLNSPEKQNQILELCLKQGKVPSRNPDVHNSVAQALGLCYQRASPGDRQAILKTLNRFAASFDSRHPTALRVLGECCKVSTPEELKLILFFFLGFAETRKDSHKQITLILYAHGQVAILPQLFQTYMESFGNWSRHDNELIRKMIAQIMLGWVGKKVHSDSALLDIQKLLRIPARDPEFPVQLAANLAAVKLKAHLNRSYELRVQDTEERKTPQTDRMNPEQSPLQAPGLHGLFPENPPDTFQCALGIGNEM